MQGATLSTGSGEPQSKSIFGNIARLDSVTLSQNGPVASMTIGGTAFPPVFDGQSVLFGNVRYFALAVGKDADGASFLNLCALRDNEVILTGNGCTVTVDDYVDIKNLSIGLNGPVGGTLPPAPYLTYGQSADLNLNGKMYRLTIHPENDTSYIATLTPLDVGVSRQGAVPLKATATFMTQHGNTLHFQFRDSAPHSMEVYNLAGVRIKSFQARSEQEIAARELGLSAGNYLLREKNQPRSQNLTVQ